MLPVGRCTRWVRLLKVQTKDIQSVEMAHMKQSHKPPRELYETRAWDRGAELADHRTSNLMTCISAHFLAGKAPGNAVQKRTPTERSDDVFEEGKSVHAISLHHKAAAYFFVLVVLKTCPWHWGNTGCRARSTDPVRRGEMRWKMLS